MHLSRVKISNFRNFAAVDAELTGDVVMVGANRIGKSNFIFAIRLVLDASLPDSARQLKLTDIWDGADLTTDPEVSIHLEFSDFDTDPNLLALLTDYRPPEDHTKARLSYVFRRKPGSEGPPSSEADYEFRVFGGGDETRSVRPEVRRRISLDVLHALRDAEGELGTWRTSPLRPLLEDAIAGVPKASLDLVAADLAAATDKLGALPPIQSLEANLRGQISNLAGPAQDIRAKLRFTPSDPLRLFRSIGLFIDDGKRGISDASLGSANIALLALKLAEFEWRRSKNERNYTIVCVEEPEAHLHPHMQRMVFRKLFSDNEDTQRGFILTTHAPNIASVAPLSSIVLLKECSTGTEAKSLATLTLSDLEREDLERYLDATRAELLFSRAVIFVEGDAEEALIPVFAKSLGYDLDDLGVSVCNVGGVNFTPYVKLAVALGLRYAVITDWDPLDGTKPPLGRSRALNLVDAKRAVLGKEPRTAEQRAAHDALDDNTLRTKVKAGGLFLNTSTLEIELSNSAELLGALVSVLEAEGYGTLRRSRLASWKDGSAPVNPEQLLSMVADVGKGRLAGRLAKAAKDLPPPAYIAEAIAFAVENG